MIYGGYLFHFRPTVFVFVLAHLSTHGVLLRARFLRWFYKVHKENA